MDAKRKIDDKEKVSVQFMCGEGEDISLYATCMETVLMASCFIFCWSKRSTRRMAPSLGVTIYGGGFQSLSVYRGGKNDTSYFWQRLI